MAFHTESWMLLYLILLVMLTFLLFIVIYSNLTNLHHISEILIQLIIRRYIRIILEKTLKHYITYITITAFVFIRAERNVKTCKFLPHRSFKILQAEKDRFSNLT